MKLPINYKKASPKKRAAARYAYIGLQGGKCYHCRGPLKEAPPGHVLAKKITKNLYPESFFEYPVHLHHSHQTDLTLGAVHNYCNAVLWEYHGE